MERWLTVPRIGTGTWASPFRPDMRTIPNVVGYCVIRSSATRCLVRATIADSVDGAPVIEPVPLDATVKETLANGGGDDLRTKLVTEITRLRAGGDWSRWNMDGYMVSEGA